MMIPVTSKGQRKKNYGNATSYHSYITHRCTFEKASTEANALPELRSKVLNSIQSGRPPRLVYERATSSRSLKCDKCDGKYFSRSELVSHKIEAHGWKPEIRTYKCRNGCGKYFEESEKRVRHEDNTCEAHEANVERLWQCEEVSCGKAFQSAHLLYLHRHAVHVRGAEVRGMLSEIGINTMPLDGSTAVRAKFRANTRLYIY
jgi:hypothetical protein